LQSAAVPTGAQVFLVAGGAWLFFCLLYFVWVKGYLRAISASWAPREHPPEPQDTRL
jgi:hypothetical protein